MHRFSLWAPKVQSVKVRVEGVSYPMQSGEHGWWNADVADAEDGMDYAFLIDENAQPYPDPRSLWQPHGVHGASRILDHARFVWSDKDWVPVELRDAVIYELHVGTFTQEGTFVAAAQRLPKLRALGITHVELMPVNSFPGRWGWGYDGVALFAPQESYGGPEGLKEFVNACHATGLAAILDVVYNHFGPVGNYTGQFGPYITESHHTPWGGAVNLEEAGSAEVRRFFLDNAQMWLREYHFDGLRLDAIQALIDRSATHFLEQLSDEVAALSQDLQRSLVLIAESDLNDPRVVTPRHVGPDGEGSATAGGYGMDAQWSDDFHHALFALLTGERRSYYRNFGSLAQVAKSLESVFVFDGQYAEFRGRMHGRPVGNLSAHRFLGYIQNHDQVGNRAHGERMHHEAGFAKAKLAAAMVLTAPFVPMIFQGEEWAASTPFLYFADHEDPELARAVSEGRKREHASEGAWDSIPDPEAPETFEKSKLIWRERDLGEHGAMVEWYQKLMELRRNHACLRDGSLDSVRVRFDEDAGWLVMDRGQMRLLFNFSANVARLDVLPGTQLLLASDEGVHSSENTVELPAWSFAAMKAIAG